MQSTILIQYTFYQIQRYFFPYRPLADDSVYPLKKLWCNPQSWFFKQGKKKHSGSDQARKNSSQSTRCFRSTEGRDVFRFSVEHKYQQPFTRIADTPFNVCLKHFLSIFGLSVCLINILGQLNIQPHLFPLTH